MGFSFKYTRYSAIAQIVLGVLSIAFGVADRATMYDSSAFHTESVVPLWMGVWFVLTGVIGYFGSMPSYGSNGRPSAALIGTYLGLSIVSIVFASTIIIIYGLGIAIVITNGRPCRHKRGGESYDNGYQRIFIEYSLEKQCNTSVALGSLIIIFAILEFGVGIWASICSCTSGCCDCCNPSVQQPAQMGQVVYIQTQHGPTAYVMTQGTDGVPVAVPAIVPGQVQMTAAPAHQVIYPSTPTYTSATGGGAQGGGAMVSAGGQGGGYNVTQAPPLENKSRDLPPVYEP